MTNTTESATTTKATAATPGAQDTMTKTASTKTASRKKNAPKAKSARKTATPKAAKPASKPAAKKASKPATKKASTASVPREGSKKQIVLDLLRRKDGATMAEIGAKTGWQNHSVRGFISGTISKKMGLKVESTKNEAGERTYRIAASK